MIATSRIKLRLNGQDVSVDVAPRESLLEVLRRRFHLYGARDSCGQGVCGACTMLVDGEAISACLYWAALADGAEVVTVEGLAHDTKLDRVQESFIEWAAFQCGFCTPGMILMARQLLQENPAPTEAEIRKYLAGNICRCGAYPEIVRSVQAAGEALREEGI